MISEDIYNNFKPTYLMIKEHEITGLQYLCKTTKKDPIKYNGSGVYWKRHIKIYGKEHIKTIWYELFTDIDELVSTALALSENFDVVNSDRWANLIPENGLDGGYGNAKNLLSVTEQRIKQGTHNFQKKGHSSLVQKRRIENGTHHFLTLSAKRVTDGTHNFLKSNRNFISHSGPRRSRERRSRERRSRDTSHIIRDMSYMILVQKERVENGTHNFQNGDHKKNLAKRIIYKEVYQLYKQLNMKIPRNTFMRSDEYLENIKVSLINSLSQLN